MRNASALGFASQLVGKGVARTHALEALVLVLLVWALGARKSRRHWRRPSSSRSSRSRPSCGSAWRGRERYRAWCGTRLEEHDLVYCFLNAIYLKLKPEDEPAEGVLVAWGITLQGQKVLLGLQLGSRESYEDWLDFGRDLIARGLRSPALLVADVAPGLW